MRKKLDDKVDDNFIGRWSRKKSELENPPAVVEQPQTVEEQNENLEKARPDTDEKVILTDADMPDIEALDESSDYSEFLSPGVSDGLRKLALRKLFRSEKFNIRDGLDDYDDDFRSFAALGDIITSDMKHQMELAEEKEKQHLAEQENMAQTEEQLTEDQSDNDEQQEYNQDLETEENADEIAEKSLDTESKA